MAILQVKIDDNKQEKFISDIVKVYGGEVLVGSTSPVYGSHCVPMPNNGYIQKAENLYESQKNIQKNNRNNTEILKYNQNQPKDMGHKHEKPVAGFADYIKKGDISKNDINLVYKVAYQVVNEYIHTCDDISYKDLIVEILNRIQIFFTEMDGGTERHVEKMSSKDEGNPHAAADDDDDGQTVSLDDSLGEIFPNRTPEEIAGMMLKEARAKRKMTQEELAKILGTSRSAISAMEKAKRSISKETARKLGKLFKMSYKAFL